ncbi:MAG: 16S rRNA (cytosine(967)-C(5))-methyltransferase RsmB [Gammaproteobacteria bacterium]
MARKIALDVLLAILQNGQSWQEARKNLNTLKLSSSDYALVQQLCLHVLRHFYYFKKLLDSKLKKPLPKKSFDIELIIILGLAQIDLNFQAHALAFETVELCKYIKADWAKGLANAIIRGYLRSNLPSRESFPDSIQYSCPTWLLKLIENQYPNQYKNILTQYLTEPCLHLRFRSNLAYSINDFLEKLKDQNIPFNQENQSIQLLKPLPIKNIPGYTDQSFAVQDAGAQLAAELLDLSELSKQDAVLDACAAPGGKTLHILDLNSKPNIYAWDCNPERLTQLKDNLSFPTPPSNLFISLEDASSEKVLSKYKNIQFSRILIDAPCSASGIIRRQPDIKWNRTTEDIKKLQDLQLKILLNLWPLLKPNGILLYATCSILEEENDQVISNFLKQKPQASILDLKPSLELNYLQLKHGLQILPSEKSEGFYYCKIKK